MIEHSDAKQRDFQIPLFKLEQRVEQLEGSFSAYQTHAVENLTKPIANMLNTKLKTYLPTVDKAIDEMI